MIRMTAHGGGGGGGGGGCMYTVMLKVNTERWLWKKNPFLHPGVKATLVLIFV